MSLSYLLSRVRWQVKDQYREKRDPHTGDDEVYGVEQRFATHRQVERDICNTTITTHHKAYIIGR